MTHIQNTGVGEFHIIKHYKILYGEKQLKQHRV